VNEEVERWKERRDHYMSLGLPRQLAGDLAWQWLPGGEPPPGSLTEAAEGSVHEIDSLPARRAIQKRTDPTSDR